ncbi:MAG: hypothetical protein SGJ00_06515 [bacterium]|nr:hypothetical protein [bacterium]
MSKITAKFKKVLGVPFNKFTLGISFKVLGLFALLAFGSACKKESKDGVAGGPASVDFPGCQLIRFEDFMVTYNADGTIATFGGIENQYVGNKVILDFDGEVVFTLLLDSRKYPISGTINDGQDSSLLTYSYNANGNLTEVEMVEMVDGQPGDKIKINHEYLNGNKIVSTMSSLGMIMYTNEYSYEGGKIDSRQDFYSRVFLNLTDYLEDFPLYGGKASKLLPTKFTHTEDGVTSVSTFNYEYDSYGKVTKQIIDDGSGEPNISTFAYLCK